MSGKFMELLGIWGALLYGANVQGLLPYCQQKFDAGSKMKDNAETLRTRSYAEKTKEPRLAQAG